VNAGHPGNAAQPPHASHAIANLTRLPARVRPPLRAALALAACFAILLPVHPASAQDRHIAVLTFERPPYYSLTREGSPKGFLLLLADRILRQAGLDPEYADMPSGRILIELAAAKSATCAVGWHMTPERSRIAAYSFPIYQDAPLVAVFRRDSPALPDGQATLSGLAAIQDLQLGLNASFSYGPEVEDILRTMPRPPMRVDATQAQLMRMLDAGRFEAMLVNPEEIEEMARDAQVPLDRLRVVPLADLRKGRLRYLLFNKSIDPGLLGKVNEAIDKTVHLE